MATGTVDALYRWPVKSMAGERAQALRLDAYGAAGDREHAVFDLGSRPPTPEPPQPRRATARETPRLLAWAASYDGAADDGLVRGGPGPRITAPGGATYAWDDPELPAALAVDLDRAVTLVRLPGGQQDRPATLLVTVEGSRRAAEEALGEPLDLRRFRPNLHLALEAEPYAEEGWVGRRLRVGEAELDVLEGCVRCVVPTRDPDTQVKWPGLLRWLDAERATTFGIIVRARGPAVVRPGDPVELL
jgi:uncharacterized protein YcbX